MNRQNLTLLGSISLGVGLGAGLMYLLDPPGGRGRRALARDKAVSKLKATGDSALKKSRHLGNRTKGLVAVTGSKLRRNKGADVESLPSESALDQANHDLQASLP